MRALDPAGMRDAQVHACWNDIGVRGDKSCVALAEHAHCRNCPTYSAGAATLLDRAPAADSRGDWTAHYAEARQVERPKDLSCVVFRLGSEWFGIATGVLDEVIELRAVHRLPHRQSPVVLGLANVRGELVVCVALDRLLGIAADAPAADHKARRLLVLRSPAGRLAIPVDEVQHAHRYHSGEMLPPPATVARSASSYTVGLLPWRDRTVARLDEARLLAAFDRSLR